MTCNLKPFQKWMFWLNLSKCNSNTISLQNLTHSVNFKLHSREKCCVLFPFTECKILSFFIKSRRCQTNYFRSFVKVKQTQIIRIQSFNDFVQCNNFSFRLKIEMERVLNNIFFDCTWKSILVPSVKSLPQLFNITVIG